MKYEMEFIHRIVSLLTEWKKCVENEYLREREKMYVIDLYKYMETKVEKKINKKKYIYVKCP